LPIAAAGGGGRDDKRPSHLAAPRK
jgi:hypothetical protein